jgi:hypothetical protein
VTRRHAPSLGDMEHRWTLERPANPSVLRVHVDHELTDRTIVTSPPAEIARPLAGALELDAVRTVDLHRYHARVNLAHGADRGVTAGHVADVLRNAWGDETDDGAESDPRAFEIDYAGPRVVAESAEMAAGRDLLVKLFTVVGVREAILGDGLALVRIGRLFTWATVEPAVSAALRSS